MENMRVKMNDVAYISNSLNIRRPKKSANVLQAKRIKSCLSWFDCGAVSISMGAHAEALRQICADDSNSSSNGGVDAETEALKASMTTLSFCRQVMYTKNSEDMMHML